MTRSVASSHVRSERAIRAVLYTTPNAIMLASSTRNDSEIIIVRAIVARMLSRIARRVKTLATAGVPFSRVKKANSRRGSTTT